MKILGLIGLKGAGKDAVCSIILEHLKPTSVIATRIAFADPLKQEVADGCGVSLDYLNQHKDNFRGILQHWGTEFRRKLCGEDYWLKKWTLTVESLRPQPDLIIVTDVRFQNEAELIRSCGGMLWRIVREFDTEDLHASEQEQFDIKCNCAIVNNSTLDDLRDIVVQTFSRKFPEL